MTAGARPEGSWRLTGRLWPTLRDPPADADAVSHKLLVRAGLVRQLAAGLYSVLPIGLRVIQRVERIVREEMDAIGAQELLLPVMNPAEIWERTGRYGIDEQFELQDRGGRAMVLAMTHEEIVA
jgi:prolyl-tRNA synthetase